MITLAEAGIATNAQIGTWVVILFAIINGGVGVLTIFSLFATRREVDKLDLRVTKLEETDDEIRQEIRRMKDDLILSADKRSSILHNRINPVVENLAAVKAGQEAFVTSFDNFTEVMRAMVGNQSARAPLGK